MNMHEIMKAYWEATVDRWLQAFEKKHGRAPTQEEEDEIASKVMNMMMWGDNETSRD